MSVEGRQRATFTTSLWITSRRMACASPIASSSRASGERTPSSRPSGARRRTGWRTRQRPEETAAPFSVPAIRSGFVALFAGLEELHRLSRHHRRDRVLVDQLRMRVAAEQDAEIVEPGNDPLELDAVHEKYRNRGLVLPDVIEEDILDILRLFRRHGDTPYSVLEPVGARRAATRGVQPLCARLIHSRCAREGESQPPDMRLEGYATRQMEVGRKAGEAFLLEDARPQEDADAARVLGAFEIERGVADIP